MCVFLFAYVGVPPVALVPPLRIVDLGRCEDSCNTAGLFLCVCVCTEKVQVSQFSVSAPTALLLI